MSRGTYLKDRAWADQLNPEIEGILEQVGGKLLRKTQASQDKDRQRATDYELHMENGDIAVRRRRDEGYRDLTIRSRRVSEYGREIKTEHAKILEGGPIAYLYCWTNSEGKITEWMCVDLRVLRSSGLMEQFKQFEKMNKDQETYFYAIPQKELRRVGALIETRKAPEMTQEDRVDELRRQHGATIAEFRRYLEKCGVAVDP